MSARTEHRNAGDLTAAWIGQVITVQTLGGPVSAVLSDFRFTDDGRGVLLHMGGNTITCWPSTTVTRGDLDPTGGAA